MKPNRESTSRLEVRAERALCEAIAALSLAEDIHALLVDLCTPAELQALADRWSVVRMLEAGRPYRAIQADTGISVTTIGRVARCLNQGTGGYRAARDALEPTN